MFKHIKISYHQFMVLVFFFTIGGAIIFIPSLTDSAKQDTWIGYIIGSGIGLLFVLLYNKLGSYFPNMTIIEYSEKILGKWLGKTVSFLYFTYFFHCTAYFLRQLGDFINIYILTQTPIVAIYIIFFLIIIMGVRIGLEPFARASEIFYPLILLLLFIFIIFISPQIQFTNIQPILENINKLPVTIYYSLDSPYLQLVTFLMLFPFVIQFKKTKKSFILGTLIGSIFLSLIILLSTLVLGVYHSSNLHYATYILAQKINIGNIIQRIEVIIALIWLVALYFKTTIFFYAANLSLAQILNLKDYRPLTFPLGILSIIYAIVSVTNIASFKVYEANITTLHHLTFGLFFPLILLIISKLKKTNKDLSKIKH
ncbi:GerAB/ArcD/ProY family transporter [Paenibacillus antarcticus]|uniref:Uncharacterized protein n=1 Tax=Paenibacillus antarcticus TaxID=253703 RepID=A0A162M9E7_9BACL|nr:endospore germination permease [Paenibacillus antarcticus]OAB40463.1 hypothetical protein PBAT_24540 [Paenibacillus antarcticus]